MRRGVSLRVRQSGADCILGVKKDAHAHGGFFERDEEEAPLPSSKVDLNVLDGRISSELMEIVGEKALAPRFGSDIRRTLKMLNSMAQISKSPSMKASSSPASGGSRLMKSSSSSRPESPPRCSSSVLRSWTRSP